MAVELGSAYISLLADTRGLAKSVRKGLGEIETEADRTGKVSGSKLGGGLSKGIGIAGTAVAGLTALVGGLALKGGIDRALNIENAQAKLKGLGHSTDAVKSIMDNALASVKGTAFGMGEAASTAAGAVAAGVKPGRDLERTLKLVADSATIAGTDMGEMGAIFNKVASSNKIQGDVIAQLSDQGIPIVQLMAKELGITAEETVNLASAGKINFDTFRNAMESGLGGAALESGSTTQGAFKNMMASLSRAGESFLGGVFPMFKEGFGGITGMLDGIGPVAEKAGAWLGTALTNGKNALQGLFDLVIKGDFTSKFREAFNLEEDSGVVTFLLNMRDTAITVFNEVRGGIAAFVAAFQSGGSDVTSSGLAGFLERLGLAARGAFGYVTGTVLPTLQSTAQWIMRNRDYLLPLVAGITAMVVGYKAYTTALAIWSGIQKAGIAIQVAWNAVLAANPIGIVVLAIAGLVAALVWFFTQTETGKAIVQAAWSGIQAAISSVADWWTGTAWPAISAVITWLGQAFQTVGSVISGVWAGIKSAISVVWNWIRDNVFSPIMWWIDVVKIAFGLYRDALVGAWGKIKDGLASGWSWIRDNVFQPLKDGVGLIGTAFESVKGVIETAWNALKEIAAKPVNFILGTVYNDGIREWWNKISGAVGMDSLALPKASLVKFAQGTEDHRAQIARGGAMRLWAEPETGGEAYIPLAQSKRGRSTAILANVAQRFGYSLSAYKDGGFWNSLGGLVGDAWDTAKNVGRSIWDTGVMAVEVVKDPIGAVKKAVESGIISPLMQRIGVGGDFVKILTELPMKFAGGLAEKVKSMLGEQQASTMANGTPGSGVGLGMMGQMLQSILPGARVTSGFRAGARTAGFGAVSFHALGRALDIGAGGGRSLSQIWDVINAAYGSQSQELLYTPKGANQILRGGKRGNTSGVTAKNHYDHVHWAMANGGVIPGLYDNGGWIPDGGMALNLSGRPEAVLDPEESAALKNGLNQGPLVNQIIVRDEREAVRELESLRRRAFTQNRLGVPR